MPGPRGWGIVGAVLRQIVLAGVLAALVTACGGPSFVNGLERAEVARALADYGVEIEPAEDAVAVLGWQAPPQDCVHTYRLRSSYEPGLRFEQDNEGGLAIGRHPRLEPDHEVQPGPIVAGGTIPAHLFYQGFRAERVGASRDAVFARHMVGPAAPTPACMPNTWDPMEDALALGWPELTGRLTGVGESWNGMRVGGKCNRSACIDTEDGKPDHALACVTAPWRERFGGLFEHDGEQYAWLHSKWSDGHGPDEGINTERHTLVSIDHGRPVWSRTVVDHRYGQPLAGNAVGSVVRTWTLESTDGCPGSLAAAGWARPPAVVEEDARLQDRLANSDSLRRSSKRNPRASAAGSNKPE
ncbi:MAG: hypothetical protein K0V04_29535 [Deltaproteobacteria bacterium]|nr:hypothetical protein [Deltaproteobacteria bacterium]